MAEILKPCPCCGGEAGFVELEDGGIVAACQGAGCVASGVARYPCGDEPRPLVAEAWNQRARLAREPLEYDGAGRDRLWSWFSLSYSAYAVLPRVMMHGMPDDWQDRMAALLEEWDEAWTKQPAITAHVQIKQANRFIKTPEWLLNYRHPDMVQLESMRASKA